MKTFFKEAATLCLLVFFVFIASAAFSADSNSTAGEKTFNEKKCGSCHRTERPAGGVAALDAAEGPELWYAGSKFRGNFLRAWLKNPLPIRYMVYGSIVEGKNPENHPRLSASEAKKVASYLLTLKTKKVIAGSIKPKATNKASIVFEKKLGCYGCHLIRDENMTMGGLSGPTLVGAGTRLNPDWIYSFLNDPAYYTPHMTMPVYAGMISDREMRALASFVATF